MVLARAKGKVGAQEKMIQGYNLCILQKLATKPSGAGRLQIQLRCLLWWIVVIRSTHGRSFVCQQRNKQFGSKQEIQKNILRCRA